MLGIDDAILIGLLGGGGLGALTNKKNPLQGALMGAGLGALGGGVLPGVLGLGGGGATAAGAATPALETSMLGNIPLTGGLETAAGAGGAGLMPGMAPGLGTGGGALMAEGMPPGMAPGLGTGGGPLSAQQPMGRGIAALLKNPRLPQVMRMMAKQMQSSNPASVNMQNSGIPGQQHPDLQTMVMLIKMKQAGLL